jgi:hypothetical protein
MNHLCGFIINTKQKLIDIWSKRITNKIGRLLLLEDSQIILNMSLVWLGFQFMSFVLVIKISLN